MNERRRDLFAAPVALLLGALVWTHASAQTAFCTAPAGAPAPSDC